MIRCSGLWSRRRFAVRVEPRLPSEVMDPEFSAAPYERMVVENAEVRSIVGEPVLAEAENGVTFKYDLDATETNDNNYFTIDNYGQIRVGEVEYPSPIPAGIIGHGTATPRDGRPGAGLRGHRYLRAHSYGHRYGRREPDGPSQGDHQAE